MMPANFNLLYPKFTQIANRIKYRGKGSVVKAFLAALFGLFFWAGIFIIFCRVLYYFRGIDVFGDFLASKLLSMIFLTFFSILIFSNVITAISSFFMSQELQLIISKPFDLDELFFSKLLETVINSSWMVLLFSLPVFMSYGVIFKPPAVYYIVLVGTVIPFLFISSAIGIATAICLIKVFPAKRLRDILVLLALFLFIALYFFFRLLKPERLVDPDTFFTVVDYLTSLQMPTSHLLPSQWATDILSALLFSNGSDEIVFNIALIWSTALAFIVILNWIFRYMFFDAWSKSQEARSLKITRHKFFNRLLEWMLSPLSLDIRAVIEKDIRSFFRDTAQWSQLFILSAIIFIYLYNFSVLPMESSPIPTIQLQNLIAFLNLGLAGFAVSAVAVRFAFTAVSLEGEAFWIIRSSPMGLKGFLWCKFWFNFIFLLLLAEILIVCSNYFIRVEPFMMAVSTITVFLMTFGLTSLSIGFGATYPRFRYENVAQIPTGFGGLMYMISAVLFVGAIVVLEARPVYLILMSRFTGRILTQLQWAVITGSFLIVLVLSVAVFIFPMKIGLKKLSELEVF